jgi:hypothetical protein
MPDADIPCLSLWQPWASVMLLGPKDLENRPWPTKYRGPLLVHAAKNRTDDTAAVHAKIQELWPEWNGVRQAHPMVFGAIVGVVTVVGCGRPASFSGNPWAWGPFCHVWDKRTPLATPIPYRGAQGMFRVPASVVASALREICGRRGRSAEVGSPTREAGCLF